MHVHSYVLAKKTLRTVVINAETAESRIQTQATLAIMDTEESALAKALEMAAAGKRKVTHVAEAAMQQDRQHMNHYVSEIMQMGAAQRQANVLLQQKLTHEEEIIEKHHTFTIE